MKHLCSSLSYYMMWGWRGAISDANPVAWRRGVNVPCGAPDHCYHRRMWIPVVFLLAHEDVDVHIHIDTRGFTLFQRSTTGSHAPRNVRAETETVTLSHHAQQWHLIRILNIRSTRRTSIAHNRYVKLGHRYYSCVDVNTDMRPLYPRINAIIERKHVAVTSERPHAPTTFFHPKRVRERFAY